MNLSNFDTKALRDLIKLTERKDSLLAEIGKIEGQLASILTGKPVRGAAKRPGRPAKKAGRSAKKAGRPAKAGRAARKGPRGGLKDKIVAALKEAGDAGLKVTDLAKQIGAKSANVHVWFSSTGKKHPEIKKVGKGHFKHVVQVVVPMQSDVVPS